MNGEYVNKFNTNWPGIFGSRETSKEFGLPEPINKVEAAIPYIKGLTDCVIDDIEGVFMNGGGSRRRRGNTRRPILYKKKSIHRYKKMRCSRKMHARSRSGGKSRRSSKNKRSIKGRRSSRSRRGYSRKQSGGDMQTRYHQYGSDIPNTPSYSVGGILPAKNLGLANPPPYQKLSNCTNCVDNYNHYTNKGFQFW